MLLSKMQEYLVYCVYDVAFVMVNLDRQPDGNQPDGNLESP